MRNSAALLTAFAVLLIAGSGVAAQTQTPKLADAGTTPDSILYGVDRAIESLSLALTFSKEGKAKKRIQMAEERLSESRVLAERNKTDLANRTADEYRDNIERAQQYGQEVAEAAQAGNITQVVSRATSIHMQVLERQGIDPDEIGYSAKRVAERTTVETETDPVQKADKMAAVAGHRANESLRLAEDNQTDLAAETANDYGEQMQELQRFGANISDAAVKRNINEVVARATQAHQQVLQRVAQKVPEQAQDAIARAMERAQTGHQMAVQALQASGGVPAGIQESIPGPGSFPGVSPGDQGMNASEAITTARTHMQTARDMLEQANTYLDNNETQQAEAAYEDAVASFEDAISVLQGVQNQTAQDLLSQARQAKSNAQRYAQQVEDYNQQTGQTTNQTTDGSTNTTSPR